MKSSIEKYTISKQNYVYLKLLNYQEFGGIGTNYLPPFATI